MFVESVGQYDPTARLKVLGGDHAVWQAEDAIWLTILGPAGPDPKPDPLSSNGLGERPREAVHLKFSFPGANPRPQLEPFGRLSTRVSYPGRRPGRLATRRTGLGRGALRGALPGTGQGDRRRANLVVAAGGYKPVGPDDETWVYDLSANTWTNMAPAAWAGHALAYLGGNQVLRYRVPLRQRAVRGNNLLTGHQPAPAGTAKPIAAR